MIWSHMDPRTPVLVGTGAVQQRLEDATRAKEPVELMVEALQRAAHDAGSRELLASADAVMVPRGFWDYPDPGRLVAERFGAAAKTTLAELGILQTTLFAEASQAIARGGADVVLVCGGEARYRTLRAQIAGVEAPLTPQPEKSPPRGRHHQPGGAALRSDVAGAPVRVDGKRAAFRRRPVGRRSRPRGGRAVGIDERRGGSKPAGVAA